MWGLDWTKAGMSARGIKYVLRNTLRDLCQHSRPYLKSDVAEDVKTSRWRVAGFDKDYCPWGSVGG